MPLPLRVGALEAAISLMLFLFSWKIPSFWFLITLLDHSFNFLILFFVFYAFFFILWLYFIASYYHFLFVMFFKNFTKLLFKLIAFGHVTFLSKILIFGLLLGCRICSTLYLFELFNFILFIFCFFPRKWLVCFLVFAQLNLSLHRISINNSLGHFLFCKLLLAFLHL